MSSIIWCAAISSRVACWCSGSNCMKSTSAWWRPCCARGLAKELRTVHLQNLADLEIRKIATRATIPPLVQSFPVPANSDYYPYLDLNAARYRFLQQGAGDLAGLNASSVPVIPMLEGTNTLPQVSLDGADYFSRIEQIRRAQYIQIGRA